ncbi:hypothetical protein [Pseudolysinimonas yzui]|uniref:Uncharacterized protein n=1 Tax=Pseudolysinimonas yzui TaxID=2708254 RepID=A0A8J3GQB1_9MICO|nr:hypothetical protein [Pseudolysinimonas yzui]GHF13849.1 hypothetical protein GCM10011600_13470 [Pseudolysinimonas yzui]
MIRVVLAGSTGEVRATLASLLGARLGLPAADGFVLADPPADPAAFDAELARRGAEVDALVNLGGAPEPLLDHYGRAVVEAPVADVEVILERLRETLVAG